MTRDNTTIFIKLKHDKVTEFFIQIIPKHNANQEY